ncbi:hypothetical protein I4U23_021656 [Adineta vaga]|nr:hypothetical protein I4U23_021656 [Adineta vaga]
MNFFVIFLLTVNVILAIPQDLSGSYHFLHCSCTVLRCLEVSPYRLYQSANGDMTINYQSNKLAAFGKITTINNGQQTQISMRWIPGMDFDTNCTGLWIPKQRSFDLKCGDQQRYCTAHFQCQSNSGPCATTTTTSKAFSIHCHVFEQIIIGFISFLLIKKIVY